MLGRIEQALVLFLVCTHHRNPCLLRFPPLTGGVNPLSQRPNIQHIHRNSMKVVKSSLAIILLSRSTEIAFVTSSLLMTSLSSSPAFAISPHTVLSVSHFSSPTKSFIADSRWLEGR